MKTTRTPALLAILLLAILENLSFSQDTSKEGRNPADELAPHFTQVTWFGERADWSPDGNKIIFLGKTYGDVFELELATGIIRNLTSYYYHGGYTRALYLSNGDILLSGCTSFDAENPGLNRRKNAELWVLDKSGTKPPVALGTKCYEGPAVSRRNLKIVYAINHDQYPELGDYHYQFWLADITYQDGVPKLANKELILDNHKLDFRVRPEPQNFRPPFEKELIFSAYDYGTRGPDSSEVMGIDLETKEIVNYSEMPDLYQEPEGIFPDGKYTLMETDEQTGQGWRSVDIWKLKLDGSQERERLTFFTDYPSYKSSNPVVSDDGKYMAFQIGRTQDNAGVGYGIFIYDFETANSESVSGGRVVKQR